MNTRSVALQGFGFGRTLVAVQGFGYVDESLPEDTPANVFGGPAYVRRQNEWIIRAIVVAITSGFLK